MTPQEKHQLISELISGEELSDFRRASLQQGIASIRHRRERRQAIHAALVCLPFLLIAAVVLHYFSREHSARDPGRQPVRASVAVEPGPNLKTEFIDDEELFRLFPGRAMALIGKPGEQELLFLDGPSSSFRQ